MSLALADFCEHDFSGELLSARLDQFSHMHMNHFLIKGLVFRPTWVCASRQSRLRRFGIIDEPRLSLMTISSSGSAFCNHSTSSKYMSQGYSLLETEKEAALGS